MTTDEFIRVGKIANRMWHRTGVMVVPRPVTDANRTIHVRVPTSWGARMTPDNARAIESIVSEFRERLADILDPTAR